MRLLQFLVAGFALWTVAASAEPSPPLVASAREQVGVTLFYDAAYTRLAFPGGDVAPEKGVCTDVIVRAYRKAYGFDLQKAVNADMRKNFSTYPQNWGLKGPDSNIDHRRVPNLRVFLKHKGVSLPVTDNPDDYKPGDLVTQTVLGKLPHIVIVSDKSSDEGRPLVIHNIGAGAREEDSLFVYPITGHYRFTPAD